MHTHADKAKFILALHKHSLQAFADGGTALDGPNSNVNTMNATNPNTSGVAGAVGNVLGLNNNFQAGAANIQAGTNQGQLNGAYTGVQGGLAGQQAFVNQAQAQGGFGNQANVFAQQQALSNQLAAQSRGEGPNPAQAQLNQATGQNVANQGALMAGQRGAASNVGLLARQAGQQGAATQQQAVGQSATLQAQQQIAAQAALANQQAQMQNVASNQIATQGQGATNLSSAQQNEQNILQGANTSYNNAAVAQQANINNVNAQTAASNQNMAGNIFGGITSAASSGASMLGMAQGGMVKGYADGGDVDSEAPEHMDVQASMPVQSAAPVSVDAAPASGSFQGTPAPASSGPNIPSTASNPVAGPNPFAMQSSGGGGGGGAGIGSLAMLAAADGGQVMGGVSAPALMTPGSGPQSFAGQWLNSNVAPSSGPNIGSTSVNPQFVNAGWGKSEDKGKSKPAPSSQPAPQGAGDSSQDLTAPKMGSQFSGQGYNLSGSNGPSGYGLGMDLSMAKGGKVKPENSKERAVKKDNSYSNDKVPALLSEGEIVLPRSVTTHPNAPQKAAEFVQAVMNKRRMGRK